MSKKVKEELFRKLYDQTYTGLRRFVQYRTILKEDEFALVMKRYIEGYSYREIGQMTGNTEAGSKMKITRLITKLRKNIRDNVILMVSFVISFF